MVAEYSSYSSDNVLRDDSAWVEMQTKMAFQEDSMQQLNDIVAQQQKDILQLQSQMSQLIRELNSVLGDLESGASAGVANQKPPHY